MSAPEAPLVRGEGALVPGSDGWFVLNVRDTEWLAMQGTGACTFFEGPAVRFAEVGIGLNVLGPGDAMAMYHGEDTQEDFLVLSGEATLIVEDQERPLLAWDFFHCPPWTAHVIVGAGEGCVVLAVGARRKDRGLRYLVSEVARRHGAGVERETALPQEAYAAFPEPSVVGAPDGPWSAS